ncbi:Las1 [Dillenia turbinata]|uniref:Las1 n=1 Tax=Dillenia turbinata TaxID=194707 RepID=A0AAN8U769_9MAGN
MGLLNNGIELKHWVGAARTQAPTATNYDVHSPAWGDVRLVPIRGFDEKTTMTDYFHGRRKTPSGYKLVPWMNWDEWDSLRLSLFSSSPDSVASALDKVSAWRAKGCLPVVIEITAAFVEIQQKDPFFRLVNGVVERARQKNTNLSLDEAGGAIQLPRMLIDVRHEGSHRDLPSLQLVRLASIKALDWLKSHYWEPQKNAIPINSDRTPDIRNEIKCRLHELALCFKTKHRPITSTPDIKSKRIKHCERLCGRNKLFSLVARKLQPPKSIGKPVLRTLKRLVQMYSSFPLEVLSVLVELLLNLSYSSSSPACTSSKASQNVDNLPSALDDWKLVMVKLSKKEPDLLVNLLKAVLKMATQTQESMVSETGGELPSPSKVAVQIHRIEQLSILFVWLLQLVKGLKRVRRKSSADETESSSEKIQLPKQTLLELLREWLLLTAPRLKDSALLLAQMAENVSLVEKLKKLPLQGLSNMDDIEDDSTLISYDIFLDQQEESIHKATQQVEFVKQCVMKTKGKTTRASDGERKSRWVVAKSWNRCPIGMLPSDIGSGGRLPNLDCINNQVEIKELISSKDHCQVNASDGKRKASPEVEQLEGSCVKRMRGTAENSKHIEEDIEVDVISGIKDRLLIGGVWKKVGKDELLSILSTVRILV